MSYQDDKATVVTSIPATAPGTPGDGGNIVVDGINSPLPPVWDYFRSAAGSKIPNSAADYTAPITHNGFIGIGMTADPISPLEFGDSVRNDVIRISDGGATNPHQFSGLGFDGTAATTGMRYQTQNLGNRHTFYGAVDPSSSKQYAQMGNRYMVVGDPNAPVGEGYFQFTMLNGGDDGYIQFNSPNSAPGGNKIQGQIRFDSFSGNANVTGCVMDLMTATTGGPNTPLQSRLMINGAGDVLISDQTVPYTSGTGSTALVTINGAMRIKGGAIVPGFGRQTGGIVFGAGPNGGGFGTQATAGDEDGGISSIGDGNLTFFTNGAVSGTVNGGGVWAKPGGGVWAATSDRRTKRDILPHASNPIAALDLEPVEFYYNGAGQTVDDGRRFVGFIAQDLLDSGFGHWVSATNTKLDGSIWDPETDEGSDRTLSVDSSNLIYELLAIAKMQQERISELTNRIAALEDGPKQTTKKLAR